MNTTLPIISFGKLRSGMPMPHLLGSRGLNTEPAPWRDRMVPPPSYTFGEHVIWGATGRILQQFLELTKSS